MATTLIVPSVDGSGPDHWQTWLQQVIPDTKKVWQSDWGNPNLSLWADNICRAIDRHSDPVWIVAHGFGCLAAVQAANDYSDIVAGAMLVAPLDPYHHLHPSSLPPQPLDFRSVVVASSNDPHTRIDKAELWADFWNSSFINIGRAGHIDAEAGFGPWWEGVEIFENLRRSPRATAFQRTSDVMRHFGRAL
jgi:predicted alpha/beta hydrolase family esterase